MCFFWLSMYLVEKKICSLKIAKKSLILLMCRRKRAVLLRFFYVRLHPFPSKGKHLLPFRITRLNTRFGMCDNPTSSAREKMLISVFDFLKFPKKSDISKACYILGLNQESHFITFAHLIACKIVFKRIRFFVVKRWIKLIN